MLCQIQVGAACTGQGAVCVLVRVLFVRLAVLAGGACLACADQGAVFVCWLGVLFGSQGAGYGAVVCAGQGVGKGDAWRGGQGAT